LQDRREVLTATSTSGSPNGLVEGLIWPFLVAQKRFERFVDIQDFSLRSVPNRHLQGGGGKGGDQNNSSRSEMRRELQPVAR
jgi:hypothetical protein